MSDRETTIRIRADGSQAVSELTLVESAVFRLSSALMGIGSSMLAMGAAFSGISRFGKQTLGNIVEDSVEFEKQMIKAARALDLTDSELADFRTLVTDAAPDLGLLNTEFAEFVTEAAKLGIPKDVMNEFAILVAETRIATDTDALLISKNFAAVRAIFALTVDDLQLYAATVNHLDDEIGGTYQTITKFVERAGATGSLVGIDANELAAMGATFARLGVAPERAGRAMNNFFSRFASYETLSNAAMERLANLGWTLEEFQQSQATDPNATMLEFLERVSKLDDTEQISTIIDIFGRDPADEILTLIKGLDTYKNALAIVNDEQESLNKLEREQIKNASTVAFKYDVFQSQLQAIYLTLGDSILPILSSILDDVKPLLDSLVIFFKDNPKTAKWVIGLLAFAAILSPVLMSLGYFLIVIALLLPMIAGLFSPISLMIGLIIILLAYFLDLGSIIQSTFNNITSMFPKTIGTLFGSSEQQSMMNGSSNSTVNYQPSYVIEGFGNADGESLLDLIRSNDRNLFNIITDAGNRIKRSIFG